MPERMTVEMTVNGAPRRLEVAVHHTLLDVLRDEVGLPPTSPEWKEAWRVTEAILRTMRDECRKKGTPFALVTLTRGIQVTPRREGDLGRIGLAVAPSDPRVVYALVEADSGGVFRSDDAGKTWSRGEIVVNHPHPKNPSETAAVQLSDGRVMLNNRSAPYRTVAHSSDGGVTWSRHPLQENSAAPF